MAALRATSIAPSVGGRARPVDADDLGLLGHCVGPTIDVGCGPGRLTAALADRGHPVLGIDVAHACVAQALGRGGVVLRRDVFGPLPGEGRWRTALLADGAVGIGADPVGLLRRVRRLLDPRGRVVVEVGAPGTPLGLDDVPVVAAAAGLRVVGTTRHGARWCAVLAETT